MFWAFCFSGSLRSWCDISDILCFGRPFRMFRTFCVSDRLRSWCGISGIFVSVVCFGCCGHFVFWTVSVTSTQTRLKIDAGDASLLMGSIN